MNPNPITEQARPLREERARLFCEIKQCYLLIEAFEQERNGHLLIRSGISDIRRAECMKAFAHKGERAPRWGAGHNPTADAVEKKIGHLAETLARMIQDQVAIVQPKEKRLEEVRAHLRDLYRQGASK